MTVIACAPLQPINVNPCTTNTRSLTTHQTNRTKPTETETQFWGLDGYIYLHRGGNDCGIASDAVYAKIDEKYEVPGAKSAAVKLAVENGARLAAREGRRGAVEVV